MSASRYRQFVRLCERWPLDPSKGEGRDLGELLRKRIGEAFSKGELSTISDPEKCDKMYDSLDAICNNKYKKLYPSGDIGVLGQDFENTHEALSSTNMKEYELEEQGYFSRTFGRYRLRKQKAETESKQTA